MIIKRSKKEIYQLRKNNNRIVDDYLEIILKEIIYAVNHYSEQKKPSEFWNSQLDKVTNSFYDCFTDIYANTSKTLKDIFKNIEKFEIKNIKDLTFNEDGKDLDERIKFYWDAGEEKLQNTQIDNQSIKTWLYNKLAKILETDAKVVEEQAKKHKKPIIAPGQYLIAEVSGCGCGYGGNYPADDYPDPPFHPNCPATVSFSITDDPDDIYDLDLIEEDIE